MFRGFSSFGVFGLVSSRFWGVFGSISRQFFLFLFFREFRDFGLFLHHFGRWKGRFDAGFSGNIGKGSRSRKELPVAFQDLEYKTLTKNLQLYSKEHYGCFLN